ncbi:MAG TPA: hypothetical protein VHA73_11710 [Acidimicrobiales bacterium]|nr:hypothetical protein [Acidimicrobiales bacterium]
MIIPADLLPDDDRETQIAKFMAIGYDRDQAEFFIDHGEGFPLPIL